MWNDSVSIYDILAQQAVAAFWQHPIVGTMFVAAQSALVLWLAAELLKGDRTVKPVDPFEGAVPMRLRR